MARGADGSAEQTARPGAIRLIFATRPPTRQIVDNVGDDGAVAVGKLLESRTTGGHPPTTRAHIS
jgi:hypothetical protein